MTNSFAILRLLWSPRSLAIVAMEVCNPIAIIASALAISLGLGTLAGAAFGGLREPYASLGDYLQECAGFAVRFGGGFGVLFTPWVILFSAIFRDNRRSRWAAESRAVILSPISFVLPLAMWCAFAILAQVQSSGFGLASGKPGWIMSPVISFLGSPWWLLAGVVAVIVHCERATRQVRRTFREIDPPQCAECGYCLNGLPQPRCPECGQEFVTSTTD